MAGDEKEKDDSLESLTRREWLLRLGAAAGVFGVAPSLNLEAVAKVADSDQNRVDGEFPAGLYAPALNHLTHALTNSERFVAVPAGSPTDFVGRQSRPFRPQFFAPEEYEVVQRLVELVLDAGKTSATGDLETVNRETRDEIAEWLDLTIFSSVDIQRTARQLSPQARTLSIQFYGEQAVDEVENADYQRIWRDGLDWLDEASRERYGKPFLAVDEREQIAILTSISDLAGKHPNASAGTRLFALLKRQVCDGYYTSRQGLEEIGLDAVSFHAESPGCPKSGHP